MASGGRRAVGAAHDIARILAGRQLGAQCAHLMRAAIIAERRARACEAAAWRCRRAESRSGRRFKGDRCAHANANLCGALTAVSGESQRLLSVDDGRALLSAAAATIVVASPFCPQ